jgi:MFS family permease
MVMVVVSRAVQGIGGGGLVTMVEVIMTDMVPLEERAIYLLSSGP